MESPPPINSLAHETDEAQEALAEAVVARPAAADRGSEPMIAVDRPGPVRFSA